MKAYARTVCLALAAVILFAWNLYHAKHSDPPRGIPVLLAHTCSWQESFRQIGDDRRIIVTQNDPDKLEINHLSFDEAGLRKEFALIYGTRAERLAWFEGHGEINYGEAVRTMSGMYSSGYHLDIALMNPREELLYTSKPGSGGPCPYKR